MSKSIKGQFVQGPLLIKIEAFPKAGKTKKCSDECSEKCHRSYTIFDPKPPRQKSKSEDKKLKDFSENTLNPGELSLTEQKEENQNPYSKSSTESSIHVQREIYVSNYEELNTVTSKQSINNNISKLEHINSLPTNKETEMARDLEIFDEQNRKQQHKLQQMPPNDQVNLQGKSTAIAFCQQDIEITQARCLCSDNLKGQKRTKTEIADYPAKLFKACNRNAFKVCNRKSGQSGNPDYTIEISVELAQNKKKKAAQLEQQKKTASASVSNGNLEEHTEGNHMKSLQFAPETHQNDIYMNEKKSTHSDLSKYHKADLPTRIAKITDRRTLTARQSQSMNQPEEISISVDTSRVEISTEDGKQTLLKNKRSTKIRSTYAEWDADMPAGQPKALMDHSGLGDMTSTEKKQISSGGHLVDRQHADYIPDSEYESPENMEYMDKETRRDQLYSQMPAKSSRESTMKTPSYKQIDGSLYKRTTKLRTDGDMNQPDKFSVISEIEEGEVYLTPESGRKSHTTVGDREMMKLFETGAVTKKPSRHLSAELDEVMNPDKWSLDEQDIVDKRKNLFERARALSAGLLERARSLSAGAQSDRDREDGYRGQMGPHTGRYQEYDGMQPTIESEQISRGQYHTLQSAPPSQYDEMQNDPNKRSIGVSTSSPPISLASFIEKNRYESGGGHLPGRIGIMEDADEYQASEIPSQVGEADGLGGRYEKSEFPSLTEVPSHAREDAGSRDGYPYMRSQEEDPEQMGRFMRSDVGSSSTMGDMTDPQRKSSDYIAATRYHSNLRDIGASTSSPFDIHGVKSDHTRHGEPYIPSNIEDDEYLDSTAYANIDDTQPEHAGYDHRPDEEKDSSQPECYLEIFVIEKHGDNCPNKRKTGDEGDTIDGHKVISRQIVPICQDADSKKKRPYSTDEHISDTKSTPLHSGRRRTPESDRSKKTEETVYGTKAAPVYSERRKPTEEPVSETKSKSLYSEKRPQTDKDKSDVISETSTTISSVTSKKSSFSGHLPDFRSMPVRSAPIDRKPTSMFKRLFSKKNT